MIKNTVSSFDFGKKERNLELQNDIISGQAIQNLPNKEGYYDVPLEILVQPYLDKKIINHFVYRFNLYGYL